jgi:hypothetical protein
MYSSKKRYSHGTQAITWSNKKIEVESKWIAALASRYRMIRQKLLVLSSVVNDTLWQDTLKVLEDTDIRGLTTEDHDQRAEGAKAKRGRLGTGRKRLTWIWFVAGPQRMDNRKDEDDDGSDSASDDEAGWVTDEGGDGADREGSGVDREDDPALWIEFCSTRARAHRWQEECMLLEEELSRVERFWAWDAAQWRQREGLSVAGLDVVLSAEDMQHPELVERARLSASVLATGKRAYARWQALMREKLHLDAVQRHAVLQDELQNMEVFGEILDGTMMVECATT